MQVKINEHIANVEHQKVIIPNLIAHSHINIKSIKPFHITRINKNLQEVLNNITNNIEATQTLKLTFNEEYHHVITHDEDEDEE